MRVKGGGNPVRAAHDAAPLGIVVSGNQGVRVDASRRLSHQTMLRG
jgi:hypothetical protein